MYVAELFVSRCCLRTCSNSLMKVIPLSNSHIIKYVHLQLCSYIKSNRRMPQSLHHNWHNNFIILYITHQLMITETVALCGYLQKYYWVVTLNTINETWRSISYNSFTHDKFSILAQKFYATTNSVIHITILKDALISVY